MTQKTKKLIERVEKDTNELFKQMKKQNFAVNWINGRDGDKVLLIKNLNK